MTSSSSDVYVLSDLVFIEHVVGGFFELDFVEVLRIRHVIQVVGHLHPLIRLRRAGA